VTAPRVIAIDGPAASGKSSTAAAVARALGFVHVDSGSLYRALTWVSAHRRVDDPAAIIAEADSLHVTLQPTGSGVALHIDGVGDIEHGIRATDVNASVSAIAAMPLLRDWVNSRIRRVTDRLAGVVIDGRDIGTVVFPNAPLKVFLTATAVARAERRLMQRDGIVDRRLLDAEAAELAERDRRDAGRATAPLREPHDAIRIDTTALTFEQQVNRIVALAHERGLA
jgi:cytidylate kinase